MPLIVFEGTVSSGQGRGKCFMTLPWVKSQITKHLGYEAYPGTLNIRLTPESTKQRLLLDPKKGLPVEPEKGYYCGVLFKAEIMQEKAAVVLPIVPDYPSELLELVAPINLRGKLGLKDGEKVTVAVTV